MTKTATPFVRQEMLAPSAPPLSAAGPVLWMRENLFSSPLNVFLTLMGVLLVYLLVSSAAPWWLNSVWNANSLGECRQIVIASAGEGATGACWAMVRERWHQFLFGFYPSDLYWRPTLALALLFVALSPVLFTGAPRALLWVTISYPFVAFWLLWGGSIWSPLVVVMGFVILGLAYRLLNGKLGVPMATGIGVVAAVVFWLVLDAPLRRPCNRRSLCPSPRWKVTSSAASFWPSPSVSRLFRCRFPSAFCWPLGVNPTCSSSRRCPLDSSNSSGAYR